MNKRAGPPRIGVLFLLLLPAFALVAQILIYVAEP